MTEYSQVALLDTDMVFDVDAESLLLSSLVVYWTREYNDSKSSRSSLAFAS